MEDLQDQMNREHLMDPLFITRRDGHHVSQCAKTGHLSNIWILLIKACFFLSLLEYLVTRCHNSSLKKFFQCKCKQLE